MRHCLLVPALLLALVLSPGLRAAAGPAAPLTQTPLTGFTALFNGRDTTGWHFSRTVHHGTTGQATVEDGAIVLRQEPFGQGGLLLTDKRYRDFELYLETDINPGYNSGIFFRSTEGGSAYQIELTGAASTGNLLGENLAVSQTAQATRFAEVWKAGAWNSFRLRVTGDAPKITLWINDVQMWEVQQPKNDKIAGEVDGFIGLQLHWTAPTSAAGSSMGPTTWKPGGALRFRNLFIKEL
jgi:hypothetical protein